LTEGSQGVTAVIVGAAIGAMVGYVFFSERGRHIRRAMEPALDDLRRELAQFRLTLQKASNAANEGWQLLNEAMAPVEQRRFHGPPQTSSRF